MTRRPSTLFSTRPFAFTAPSTDEAPAAPGRPAQHSLTDYPIVRGERPEGQGLPMPLRMKMERAFGADFSEVQVKVGPEAERLRAEAFTRGTEIHVQPRLYQPHSRDGQELLAHELAHVEQQRRGRVTPQSEVGGIGIDDRPALEAEADRAGHRALDGSRALLVGTAGPPTIASTQTVQRKVLPVRGSKPPKFKSTLTGGTYDSPEAAEQAETLHRQQQEQREREVQEELQSLDEMDFSGGGSGGQENAMNPFSAFLGSHPAHFGPLMTQGGQVKTSEVSQAVGTKVLSPGNDPELDSTSHSGQNTYAGVFSGFRLLGEDVGFTPISKSGTPTPEQDLEGTELTANREFRDQHIFQQGKPRESENVSLPSGRNDAHGEALAIHSKAMEGAIEHGGQSLDWLLKQVGGTQEISAEPTDEELESFSQTLGLQPSVSPIIALNRASCKSGSGYKGGCNQEMGDMVPKLWEQHTQNVGKKVSGLHQTFGMFQPRLSVTGPYKQNADPTIPMSKGMEIGIHNKFDFKKKRKLRPVDKSQRKFQAKLNTSRKRSRKSPPESSKKKKEAPSWGGYGPQSLDPLDNWGANHPLHKRRNDRDPPGVM